MNQKKENQSKVLNKDHKLLLIVSLPFRIILTYLILHFSAHPTAVKIIENFLPKADLFTSEGQLNYFISISFYLGILLFMLTTLIMLTRVSKNQSPVPGGDPGFIGFINRIIQNCIEQFFIFAPIYLYALRNDGFGLKNQELLRIGAWFIIGRTLYVFGYIIQYFTKIETIRSCSAILNLTTSLVLILQVIGIPVLKYINC